MICIAPPPSSQFQALIGTVQTRRGRDAGCPAIPVSSPHRYCPNFCLREPVAQWQQFQALIGTVQTDPPFPLPSPLGKVSSPHRYCPNARLPGRRLRARAHVSSPHRYCPNLPTKVRAGRCLRFQALIGTVQTRRRSRGHARPRTVSSPHRYCPNLA